MKVLCLCKRRPQGRDLVTRPYGRFYHLSRMLADRGHEVWLLLLSYRDEPDASRSEGDLQWHSISAIPWGPSRYLAEARRIVRQVRPDWVIGFSDIWYGILAQSLACGSGCRSLIDAYDNYESYIPWLKPLHLVWHRSIGRADVVTAAGPQLAEHLARHRAGKSVAVLTMAADPCFYPRDGAVSRKHFALPLDKKLIGYFGALYSNRGIGVLFEAFRRIRAEHPDVELVLSGRADQQLQPMQGVRWLGYVADEAIPLLVNAVDVAAVVNQRSAFGNYSYPAKLYEAMRCGIPVVASDTAPARWILNGREECLARPGDTEELKTRLLAALDLGSLDYGPQREWAEIASELEDLMLQSQG